MAKSPQSRTGLYVSHEGLSVGGEAEMESGAGQGGAVNVTG